MHHQISTLSSGPWFWSVLVILLILGVVGFTIYWFGKKNEISNTPTETDEEEMGWEYCPNLMVELYRLRKDIKDHKSATE